MLNKHFILLPFLCISGFSTATFAEWQADADTSAVTFVSTKQSHIREVHEIQRFDVNIKDHKKVSVRLDLASVESGIPIRNDRMREMLFDVAHFRYANLTFELPVALNQLKGTSRVNLNAELDLRGTHAPVQLDLLLSASDGQITASLLKPVIITAQQFGLEKGVDALREIAGLTSIGYSVPIMATIVLRDL